MNLEEARYEYLLQLGDSDLILGQRLAALCGHGPALEEDIAMSNVALDLIGQARFWLSYAAEIKGGEADEDTLAFLRDGPAYRNVLLVEQPNGDYGHTIVRQCFYDVWHFFVLQALMQSADARIADIAAKSIKEVQYHVERSGDWVVRLGDGTEESHRRTQAAVDKLWRYTGELFRSSEAEQLLVGAGIAVDSTTLYAPWSEHMQALFAEATLELPGDQPMQCGGKHGEHTEHLGYVLAEMQHLQRSYPGARW
jgi:ring-1,2-phenylacetyl-CoA epoxidase subunit PaaC